MKSDKSQPLETMKKIFHIASSLVMFGPVAFSQEARQPVMRDAATHEQLSLAMRKVSQSDPMRRMTMSKGADPSLVNQPQDLVASSDILCVGGFATLVPKRAVMCVPKNLADRMKFQPGSRIVGWAEFYAQNRGWITTVEVSRCVCVKFVPVTK